MLTSIKSRCKGQYLIIIPALFSCSILFAKSTEGNKRSRQGDVTTYKGHTFQWEKPVIDSIPVKDEKSGGLTWMQVAKVSQIMKMDADPVFSGSRPYVRPAYFYSDSKNFSEYVIEGFHKAHKELPDSIDNIRLENIVVDKKGKVVYYDIISTTKGVDYNVSSAPGIYAGYAATIERILDQSPLWQPATCNGKDVNSGIGGLSFYDRNIIEK